MMNWRPFIEPSLTSCAVAPSARGRSATMPAKMIIDMPLPMPRSVICSPSHIRNIVPVTSEIVAVNRKLKPPPPIATPLFCSAMAAPKAWKVARPSVP